MLEKALLYANRVHDPDYLPHPVQVMENLREIGRVTDDELLATALLHDTLEWGSGDLTELNEQFGERVANLVKQLTRTEPDNPKDYSRKELLKLRHKLLMADIAVMSEDAKQIKLADRLANLHERIEIEPPEKLRKYKVKTKDLLSHIDRKVNPPLWDAIEKLLT
ncbi:MAG: bifunctional (p)ppGpp synthetase/guanosine-3',5'-bis(diphosphate) 3'-pyrophosphohydrolase [Chthonomonas sp.]|nr:bifunctional (p)ppGpp synthetase/guanosine-3',5'-bis(diphosphate) 3'-pyrophosphohydrolase [Chthonomonas sp.]